MSQMVAFLNACWATQFDTCTLTHLNIFYIIGSKITDDDEFKAFCRDDVIKWKHFSRYWLFVWGIHRSPVNSHHKDQWRGDLMFSLICAWINGWVNNRETGDLRRNRAHYDFIVMKISVNWYTCAYIWVIYLMIQLKTNDILDAKTTKRCIYYIGICCMCFEYRVPFTNMVWL